MNHISEIRRALSERALDALLVTGEKNQRYVFGFPFTDGAVLITRRRALLITDSRYIEAASAGADGAELLLFDAQHPLLSLIRDALVSEGAQRVAAEDRTLSHASYLAYERALGMPLLPAGDLFEVLRASKSEEEIEYMREAQAISERALAAVLPMIRPGITEQALAAELVYHMRRNHAEGCSFDPIVVSGENTSLPHGVPGSRVIRRGDFVTMDFGCLKHGYCSDMTRTVAVGEASEEMKNVYDLVLRAQLAGIKAARAGVTGQEIDGAARSVIAAAGYGTYFGHGFGHSLGLDIHESPSANPRNTRPMPAGAVCSAEPGIYLPGRFGVRIEDVMVLREHGSELLTAAPKELLIL